MNIDVLLGKTLSNIEITKNDDVNDMIIFTTTDNKKYEMSHDQDCCEQVYIKDICGDINDLIDSVLVESEVTSNNNHNEEILESETWTFYRFRTQKGSVVISWYGTSNGYYSENVDFFEIIE